VVYSFTLVYAFGFLTRGAGSTAGVPAAFATAVVVWSLGGDRPCPRRTDRDLRRRARAAPAGRVGQLSRRHQERGRNGSPKEERALATASSTPAPTPARSFTALIVPLIALNWGWRWAFVGDRVPGFLLALLWLSLYRSPEATLPPLPPPPP